MTAFSYFDYGRHLWISNEANNQHGLDDKRWDPLRDIVQSSLSYGYNRFAQETPADQTIERSVGSRRSFRFDHGGYSIHHNSRQPRRIRGVLVSILFDNPAVLIDW